MDGRLGPDFTVSHTTMAEKAAPNRMEKNTSGRPSAPLIRKNTSVLGRVMGVKSGIQNDRCTRVNCSAAVESQGVKMSAAPRLLNHQRRLYNPARSLRRLVSPMY